MPLKKLTLKITQENEKKRLDQALADWLPSVLNQPLSKGKVRKLIIAGAVYLNRTRVRIASKELRLGATLEVFLDMAKLNSDSVSREKPFVMTETEVLYEDEYLIAVNKPPGIPTQPTLDEARENLFAGVKKFLATRQRVSIAEVYLGLHHRLDRDTSGVIVFTKSKEANPGIASLFADHQIEKVYQALAIPTPPSRGPLITPLKGEERAWTVKNYLAKSSSGGKAARFGAVRSGGLFAHTDFQVLDRTKKAFWVEARPHTGRTHQIRVHLSESGMPIFGDTFYGGPIQLGSLKAERVMLHAVSLTFTHPIHKNSIIIRSSLPEDFSRCLKGLQEGSSKSQGRD